MDQTENISAKNIILNKRWIFNETEQRLRSGWRLLLYLAIQLSLAIVFNIALKPLYGSLRDNQTAKWALRGVVVIFIVTLAVWFSRRFFDKRSFKSLGLKLNLLGIGDLIAGFILSGIMMGIIFGTLLYSGMLEVQSVNWSGSGIAVIVTIFLWFFGIGAAVGWSEELAFRGYLLQNLGEGIGLRWAVILSCLLYGAGHMSNPNSTWLSGTLIAAIGFLRIFGWLSSGQLWLSMGMHAGWNFFQGPIFGFGVSGMEIDGLVKHSLSGPEWITGGVFGPEAGIVVVPVVLFALVIMALWTKGRKRPYLRKTFK
jgi:membrane protease YdiL (CAAX protease family)